jgi:hypothetical protein
MKSNHYRVLHAPTSVGGHPQGLSRAQRALGIGSVNWIFQQTSMAYSVDRVLWRPGQGLLTREWARLRAIAQALRFDVIHYNFGTCLSTPFPPTYTQPAGVFRRFAQAMHRRYLLLLCRFELATFKVLGKPIFVHYQGDDARQGDVLRARYPVSMATRVPPDYYYAESDAFKRDMIRLLDAACDRIYAVNPDLLRVLPSRARFLPYGHVFLDEWKPAYTQLDVSRPLRIGHAPSNRAVKGSDLVLEALESLRLEGYRFELVLVEGVSVDEARKDYESIDVLVDQLFAGWYGGVAVEAMALGKPVLVYLRDEDLQLIPTEMRLDLPFIRVTPNTIRDGLQRVLSMSRHELFNLARRSRAFVERWHDPYRIAAELKADYEQALQERGRL